jgi:hypothetical protein
MDQGFMKEMRKIVDEKNKLHPNQKTTVTDFVTMAIINELVEVRSKTEQVGPRRYKCDTCKRKISIEDIALSSVTLFGKRIHFCKWCMSKQNGTN